MTSASSFCFFILSASLIHQALSAPALVERKSRGGKVNSGLKNAKRVGKVYEKGQSVYDAAGLLSNVTTVTLWDRPDFATTFVGVNGLTFNNFTNAPLGTQDIPKADFQWVNATGTATVNGSSLTTNEFFLSGASKFIDIVYQVNPDASFDTSDPLDTLYCDLGYDWGDNGVQDGTCVLSHRVGTGIDPLIREAKVDGLTQADYTAVRIVSFADITNNQGTEDFKELTATLTNLWGTNPPTVPSQ